MIEKRRELSGRNQKCLRLRKFLHRNRGYVGRPFGSIVPTACLLRTILKRLKTRVLYQTLKKLPVFGNAENERLGKKNHEATKFSVTIQVKQRIVRSGECECATRWNDPRGGRASLERSDPRSPLGGGEAPGYRLLRLA